MGFVGGIRALLLQDSTRPNSLVLGFSIVVVYRLLCGGIWRGTWTQRESPGLSLCQSVPKTPSIRPAQGRAGQRQGRAGQAAAGQKQFHQQNKGKNGAQSPTNLRAQTLHNFHKPSTLSQS